MCDKNGAISSRNPFDPSDLMLARLVAVLVAPPHTVHSLMRAICAIEGVPFGRINLYANPLSQSPMENERISILINSSIGLRATREEPMSLVALDVRGANPVNANLSIRISDREGQSVALRHENNQLALYMIEMTSGWVAETKIRKFLTVGGDMQDLAVIKWSLTDSHLSGTTLNISTSQVVSSFVMANEQTYKWNGGQEISQVSLNAV